MTTIKKQVLARVPVKEFRAAQPLQAGDGVIWLREPEVRFKYLPSIGVSTLKKLIEREGFPAPVKFGPRIQAWRLHEVHAWCEAWQARQAAQPEQVAAKKSVKEGGAQ